MNGQEELNCLELAERVEPMITRRRSDAAKRRHDRNERKDGRQPKVHEQGAEPGQPEFLSFLRSVSVNSVVYRTRAYADINTTTIITNTSKDCSTIIVPE